MTDIPPWERQRDEDGELEPMLWYRRFRDFLRQGPGRELLAACNEWRDRKGHQRSSYTAGSWRRNCEKWHWRDRAAAYDAAQDLRIQREWEERRRELRETEWARSNELLDKVRQMLQLPIIEAETQQRTDENGNVTSVTIVKPADWRLRDIPYTFETASKLARLAAEMETERTSEEVRGEIDVVFDQFIRGLPPGVRAEILDILANADQAQDSSDASE